jgi:hypothetical protein
MPSPHPPASAVAPADAPAPCDLEVVCRTQSADTEPTGGAPSNDPIPAPSLEKARRGNKGGSKAKVYPADTPGIEEIAAAHAKKRSFFGKSSVAAPVHINASAGGTAAAALGERRSSSVFDMLEHQRQRRAPWKVKVGVFLDGIPFTIISIIFTMMVSKKCFLFSS